MTDSCDRCGIFTGSRGERVGLLIGGRLAVSATLCAPCRSIVEEQARASMQRRQARPVSFSFPVRP